MKKSLDIETLRNSLGYDPVSGAFRWKIRSAQRVKIGDVAGCAFLGYRIVVLFGEHYLAHRLAWFYVHGDWPPGQIDHRDGDKSNNAISNLRCATHAQNLHNRVFKGFSYYTKAKKYRVRFEVNGQDISVGYFETEHDARSAYLRAHPKFAGEFSGTLQVKS